MIEPHPFRRTSQPCTVAKLLHRLASPSLAAAAFLLVPLGTAQQADGIKLLASTTERDGPSQQKPVNMPPAKSASEVADDLLPQKSTHKVTRRAAETAEDAYLQGARQIRDGHYDTAEKFFLQASKLNPDKQEYLLALSVTREHRVTDLVQQSSRARVEGRDQQAAKLLELARSIDPTNPLISEHEISTTQLVSSVAQRRFIAAPTIQIKPSSGVHSFHERGDAKVILQHITAAYGIKALFDGEIPATNIRIDVDNVDYAAALRIAQMLTTIFAVPVDEKTVLICHDTPADRERLERQVEETIPLEGFTVEQLNDIANLLRNIFEVKQLVVQPSQGVLVLRAPADTVDAINRILDDLIGSSSELLINVRLYAIDTSRVRSTGITPPQSITAYSPYGEAQNIVSANGAALQQLIAAGVIKSTDTIIVKALALILSGAATSTLFSNSFLLFGGGLSSGLLSTTGATLALALSKSDTRSLDDVQLRAGDRQTATFRVGSRYPITTSIYSGISLSSIPGLGGATTSTVPQIQYEDLGLTLKATPRIERGRGIFLHLEFKLEALTGSALNTLPLIASRQFTNDVTVNDGETATLVSLVSKNEANALNGYPGLTELPGFQSVTGDDANAISSTLVMLLTPHLVRRTALNLAGPYVALPPRAGVAD